MWTPIYISEEPISSTFRYKDESSVSNVSNPLPGPISGHIIASSTLLYYSRCNNLNHLKPDLYFRLALGLFLLVCSHYVPFSCHCRSLICTMKMEAVFYSESSVPICTLLWPTRSQSTNIPTRLEYKSISSLIKTPAVEVMVLDVQTLIPQYELDTESFTTLSLRRYS